MNIKDILVQIDNSRNCKHRIQVAHTVAEEYDSHVTGLYVSPPLNVPAYAGVAVPTLAIAGFQENQKEQEQEAKKLFDGLTESWQRKISWHFEESEISSAIVGNSATHDLIVLGQFDPDDERDINFGVVDRVVIESGRPVLVVPNHPEQTEFHCKRIVVAWNGRRESVRATHDAMPFLEKAESVNIISIKQTDYDELPCVDIAAHISRHGINVETENAPSKGGSVGEIMLESARHYGADLIVMGAYGHTRIREMVLGGATRYLLKNSRIPLLMSH